MKKWISLIPGGQAGLGICAVRLTLVCPNKELQNTCFFILDPYSQIPSLQKPLAEDAISPTN